MSDVIKEIHTKRLQDKTAKIRDLELGYLGAPLAVASVEAMNDMTGIYLDEANQERAKRCWRYSGDKLECGVKLLNITLS